ncbi:MAG: hypothetical protein COV37_05935 [Bdellovibrio sp. CG11_big_fil_rev_8_21_14_0_20_39_38]|nr:MAG: hypothetical protein COV37_05935 [Bdellovibrio sp. CG11_big_fil_rev_8_21_14_0_20_39_38]
MKVISSYLDSHFNENFTIHEVGMKLTPEHQSKIRMRLQSLESRAPAISSIHLKFTNSTNLTHGELTIYGAGRRFFASINGENPWDIYKVLEREIDEQLIQWKKTRFRSNYNEIPLSKEHQRFVGGYNV